MPIKVSTVTRGPKHYTFYIGRAWAAYADSIFHNPFHIGKDGDRAAVILKFADYWYAPEQKHLRQKALLWFKEDEILGCWCGPRACHGDIIAGYVNWKRQEATLW